MNIHIYDLQGNKYDLSFPEKDVTLYSIQKKIYDDYQVNTHSFYFCANNMILPQGSHISPDFFQGEPKLVMYDSNVYKDKSYPRVDNAFNLSFSRYFEYYTQLETQNKMNRQIPEELLQQINENNNATLIDILQFLTMGGQVRQIMRNNNQSYSDSDDTDSPNFDLTTSENDNENNPDNRDYENEGYNDVDEYPEEEEESHGISFHVYRHPRDSGHLIHWNLDEIRNPIEYDNNVEYDGNNYSDDETNAIANPFRFNQPFQVEDENENDQNNEDQPIFEDDTYDEDQEQRPDTRTNAANDALLGNIFNFLFTNPQRNAQNPNENENENEGEGEDQNINPNGNQRVEGLDVDLTPEDQRAVERLMNAGFDRLTVIQVYFACDRNEEAAFNILVGMG